MRSPHSLKRLAAVVATAFALAGCLSTPITSLPRLMRLDFATLDMGAVRAGLRLPGMLRVRPGDATMTIRTRVEGGPPTEDLFALEEVTEDRERAGLAAEGRAGFALSVWRVATADVPRVAAIQQRVRASVERGPRVRGSLEIKVSGGCKTAPIPAGPVLMSSFLKPARGEPYITLLDGLDLRQVIPQSDWQAKLPACGA
jgi:hypothetical protein